MYRLIIIFYSTVSIPPCRRHLTASVTLLLNIWNVYNGSNTPVKLLSQFLALEIYSTWSCLDGPDSPIWPICPPKQRETTAKSMPLDPPYWPPNRGIMAYHVIHFYSYSQVFKSVPLESIWIGIGSSLQHLRYDGERRRGMYAVHKEPTVTAVSL